MGCSCLPLQLTLLQLLLGTLVLLAPYVIAQRDDPLEFCNSSESVDPNLCTGFMMTAFLRLIYFTTDGSSWLNSENWPEPEGGDELWTRAPEAGRFQSQWTCQQPVAWFQNASHASLPEYCCWFGVRCCVLESCPLGHAGFFDQCGCTPGTVQTIDLRSNNLSGLLPSPDRFKSLILAAEDGVAMNMIDDFLLHCGPVELLLQNNSLYGSIPESLAYISKIEVLGLANNHLTGSIPASFASSNYRQLDVTGNNLTGPLPQGMCSTGSALMEIQMSSNMLTGHISSKKCPTLVVVNAAGNKLSGPLPLLSSFSNARAINLARNNLTGTLGNDVGELRLLTMLDLSMNHLSGTIPKDISSILYLRELLLGGNKFTGSLPEEIFCLNDLYHVNLSSGTYNYLTGTIPSSIGHKFSLQTLDIRNNCLTGTIPDSFADLNPAAILDLRGNPISCCGQNFIGNKSHARYERYDLDRSRLPKGFQLSNTTYQPVEMLNERGENRLKFMSCPVITFEDGYIPKTLRAATSMSDRVPWSLQSVTHLRINPAYYLFESCVCAQGMELVNKSTDDGFVHFECELVGHGVSKEIWVWTISSLLAFLIISAIAWYFLFNQGRRSAFAERIIGLRKRFVGPPTSGIITLVLTNIEDYGSLKLLPSEFVLHMMRLYCTCLRKSKWKNYGFRIDQDMDMSSYVFHEARDAALFCLQLSHLFMQQDWKLEGLANSFNSPIRPSRTSRPWGGIPTLLPFQKSAHLKSEKSMTSNEASDPAMSMHGWEGAMALHESMSDDLGREGSSPQVIEEASGHSMTLKLISALRANSGQSNHTLFNGVRVRMTIVTGRIEKGVDMKDSDVFQRACTLLKICLGDQILLDTNTFMNIKDSMEELGAVDSEGLNTSKLTSKKPWHHIFRKRQHEAEQLEACVLDMGEYALERHDHQESLTIIPPAHRILHDLQHTAGDHTSKLKSTVASLSRFSSFVSIGGAGSEAPSISGRIIALSQAIGSVTSRLRGHASLDPDLDLPRIRLYQLLAPSYIGRAKVFGNRLLLGKEWDLRDSPYFCAPGAYEAFHGTSDLVPDQLPDVTMVFCMVDGGKAFASKYREEGKLVHEAAVAVILSTLRQVQGGYLVRQQDLDLKYMIAFKSAEMALLWCMIAQECFTYADWPDIATSYWQEVAVGTEALAFRGPRFKMGVCEGRPRSIMPDFLGRADYIGDSINNAARYMDAGAHGGQVVCDIDLALRVVSQWRRRETGAPTYPRVQVAENSAIQSIDMSIGDAPALDDSASIHSTGSCPLSSSQPGRRNKLSKSVVSGMMQRIALFSSDPAMRSSPLAKAGHRHFFSTSTEEISSCHRNPVCFDTSDHGPLDQKDSGSISHSPGRMLSHSTSDKVRASIRKVADGRSVSRCQSAGGCAPWNNQEQKHAASLPLLSEGAGRDQLSALPENFCLDPIAKGLCIDISGVGISSQCPEIQSAHDYDQDSAPLHDLQSSHNRERRSSALGWAIQMLKKSGGGSQDGCDVVHSKSRQPRARSQGGITAASSPSRSWPFQRHTSLNGSKAQLSCQDQNPMTPLLGGHPRQAASDSGASHTHSTHMPLLQVQQESRGARTTVPGEKLQQPSRPSRFAPAKPESDLSPLPKPGLEPEVGARCGESTHSLSQETNDSTLLERDQGVEPRVRNRLPHSIITRVQVLRLGFFKFKGASEPTELVQFLPDSLRPRSFWFPSEAPKGKGNRVSAEGGVVEEVCVAMSDIIQVYQDKWRADATRFPN